MSEPVPVTLWIEPEMLDLLLVGRLIVDEIWLIPDSKRGGYQLQLTRPPLAFGEQALLLDLSSA